MAFLLFERIETDGAATLRPTGQAFSLAGYNLVYSAWEKQGKPLDKGWHISADELIQLHSGANHSRNTRRLIIDFDPNSRRRLGLVEVLNIYAFTWSDGKGGVDWTPLMLHMGDAFYEEYDSDLSEAKKSEILDSLKEQTEAPEFIEFLYLNGPKYGWNWGKNGMTNAVFLQGAARDYFRQHF